IKQATSNQLNMRFDNLNDFPERDDEHFKDKYDEGDEWKNASKMEEQKLCVINGRLFLIWCRV
ncbi:MAG: hypothetical protein M3O67_04445, partial [Bacteroidota bacterium]|nr:hypothetical protein [Bacteroidota bacterium]